MEEHRNHILQLTDAASGRRCALRIDPEESARPLQWLLDRYLKAPTLQPLLAEKRITEESAEILVSLQDLVYISSDEGLLHDMFAGVKFNQGSQAIALDETLRPVPVRVDESEVNLIDLTIDRTNVGYDRNWVGFNKRRWAMSAETYSAFVLSCLEEEYGRGEAEDILEMGSTAHKMKLVRALAKRIWESDFESYSRFRGRKLVYKSGDETVRNIIEGSGGICSEKVQALKFLTDHYGLNSEFILAGANAAGPVPEAKLRELLTTFDFRYAKRYMRYWQHTALLYTIDDSSVLVDDTNGNIPFMFLKDDAAQRLLGHQPKPSVRVKMAVNEEDFYYHEVSQDIPQDLFFAMEGWIPHIDLVQVFDNELGLYISGEYMVTPIVFRNARTFDRLRREYGAACQRAGLSFTVASEWELDSPLGSEFAKREPKAAQKVLEAEAHLLARYDDCHGPGHEAGLVVIALRS